MSVRVPASMRPATGGALLVEELRRRLPDVIELRVGLNGVDAAPGEADAADLPMIALANEYGVHAPARPFFEVTFDTYAQDWLLGVRVAARLCIEDRQEEAMQVLRVAAQASVQNMQDIISYYPWEANAEATIKRKTRAGKRGDQPLIDTAQMSQSIRAQVRVGKVIEVLA